MVMREHNGIYIGQFETVANELPRRSGTTIKKKLFAGDVDQVGGAKPIRQRRRRPAANQRHLRSLRPFSAHGWPPGIDMAQAS
jgi:hypothetical protein